MGSRLDSNRAPIGVQLLWLLRSLVWAVLLPGLIAGYVPWRFFGLRRLPPSLLSWQHPAGLFCIAVGIGLLASCILGVCPERTWNPRPCGRTAGLGRSRLVSLRQKSDVFECHGDHSR